MNQKIKEIMFKIYKDGKDTDHQVGFLYINNKKEKHDRLMADYPESEGYKLVFDHEKTM